MSHKGNTLWRFKSLLPVDIPHILVPDIVFFIHGLDVVHPERKYILIVDRIDNRVCVKAVSKGLSSGRIMRIFGSSSRICWEYRCPRESEHIVLLKILHYGSMHISELAAMALIPIQTNRGFVLRQTTFHMHYQM